MPSRGNYTLFRIRGIPISVDWSWFFVLFLIIWLLSDSYRTVLGDSQDSFEPYAFAVASAFLFFGSILLHELGHATEARRHGIGTIGITLWMFGGVAALERDSRTAGEEFKVAAAGPARQRPDRRRQHRARPAHPGLGLLGRDGLRAGAPTSRPGRRSSPSWRT